MNKNGLKMLENGLKMLENGFENEFIMSIFETPDGRIWVGTDGGGVYILKNEVIEKHYTSETGLAGNVVFKTCIIDNDIWITTGTGISKYLPETDSFFNFNSL